MTSFSSPTHFFDSGDERRGIAQWKSTPPTFCAIFRVSNLHPWQSARRVAVRNRRTDMSDRRHPHDARRGYGGPGGYDRRRQVREHTFPAPVDRFESLRSIRALV